ncbi:MAG: glycerophosphodiester phosphodiesterase family protein, partial [Candidatus Kapaibacterium sp.]
MITIREFVQNNEIFIIAHRGASGTMIENTMPAFEKAVESGAKMLEVDIQVSKDKIPFAYHDANLKRINLDQDTSKLSSYDISKINLSPEGEEKVYIPKLEEVLRFCKRHEIYLVIEIKTKEDCSFDTEDVDVILDSVKSFGYE